MYFELGVILSVTTGKLLCDLGRVYDILNFMTGDNLFTHQLPRAMDECKPAIIRQYPQLAKVTGEDITPVNAFQWLDEKAAELGDGFEVEPLAKNEHEFINPIKEIADMVGPERVVVVRGDEDHV
jgi:hypothetical protein